MLHQHIPSILILTAVAKMNKVSDKIHRDKDRKRGRENKKITMGEREE
jgi:hypothetical protein